MSIYNNNNIFEYVCLFYLSTIIILVLTRHTLEEGPETMGEKIPMVYRRYVFPHAKTSFIYIITGGG